MDSDEDNQQNQEFAKNGGQALDMMAGEGFQDSEDVDEEEDEDPQEMMKAASKKDGSGQKLPKASAAQKEIKGEKLDNQPYDLAVDVNDSEEIESDEEDDVVNAMNSGAAAQQAQNQKVAQQQQNQATSSGGAGNQKPMGLQGKTTDDDDDDDDKDVPGTYNPQDYAALQVTNEVKDLFEYIQRYKPQKMDLDSKMKPFIPDYIPAVGEVDAFLKMSKPDGNKEDLGITQLDEPALNCEDKTVLELKYIQSKNVARAAPMTVDSIEGADKKQKEVSRWINSVQDLHKTRPPPTVNYTKQMPEFDMLMAEFNPEFEQALKDMQFPGPEIDMHTSDYAKLICAMLDIPIHKLANNKSIIESLHVLFTMFSEFRQNQHFQNQEGTNQAEGSPDIAQF